MSGKGFDPFDFIKIILFTICFSWASRIFLFIINIWLFRYQNILFVIPGNFSGYTSVFLKL